MSNSSARLPPPPLPREHGAWMMLYGPMAIAIVIAVPAAPLPLFLVALAATSGFWAQHAAGLLLRERSRPGTSGWLCVYVMILAASATPLFFYYRLTDLGWLALPAGLLAVRVLWKRRLTRRQIERSTLTELATVAVLALSAPAISVAAAGEFTRLAALSWAACALYFASSVFHVRMLVAAARENREFASPRRWRLGALTVIYHTTVLFVSVALFWFIDLQVAALACLAYAPAIVRAFAGWATLSNQHPSLRRVGLMEVLFALWFALFISIAGRTGTGI